MSSAAVSIWRLTFMSSSFSMIFILIFYPCPYVNGGNWVIISQCSSFGFSYFQGYNNQLTNIERTKNWKIIRNLFLLSLMKSELALRDNYSRVFISKSNFCWESSNFVIFHCFCSIILLSGKNSSNISNHIIIILLRVDSFDKFLRLNQVNSN